MRSGRASVHYESARQRRSRGGKVSARGSRTERTHARTHADAGVRTQGKAGAQGKGGAIAVYRARPAAVRASAAAKMGASTRVGCAMVLGCSLGVAAVGGLLLSPCARFALALRQLCARSAIMCSRCTCNKKRAIKGHDGREFTNKLPP